MGVKGLLSYCLDETNGCVNYVDLIQIADSLNGIELLVDFDNFHYSILQEVSEKTSDCLQLSGGEYSTLDGYATALVTSLKALNIDLVMYAGGGGLLADSPKLDTFVRRREEKIEKVQELIQYLSNRDFFLARPNDRSVRPVLSEIQLVNTLNRCGCEIRGCVDVEADRVLAQDLLSRPKALAIVSNDSDFCVFKGGRLIPDKLFTQVKKLGWKLPGQSLPQKLVVGMIEEVTVAKSLGLKSGEMVEVSILAGNDITLPFAGELVRTLKQRREVQNAGFKQLAMWVRRNKLVGRSIERHPLVMGNYSLIQAIDASRDFYQYTESAEDDTAESGERLIEEIKTGCFPDRLFTMYKKEYVHIVLLENCGPEHPCAEVELAPLRQFVYGMVLPEGQGTVEEYGRGLKQRLSSKVGRDTIHAACHLTVAADRKLIIPTLDEIDPNDQDKNLATFRCIMLHRDLPANSVKFFEDYGEKKGFVGYVLRYLVSMTKEDTLRMSKPEFLALAAMTLGSLDSAFDVSWYEDLGVWPTGRSVTIGNWYQDVYRHAYYFLAKLLYLSDLFPEPKEIYNGCVFHVFFSLGVSAPSSRLSNESRDQAGASHEMVTRVRAGVSNEAVKRTWAGVSYETVKKARVGLSNEASKRARRDMNSILRDNSELIRRIWF